MKEHQEKEMCKTTKRRDGRRRMSYSSAAIAMGNMPEEIKMNDPTIHVIMSFQSNQLPSEDDMLPIIQQLLNYSHRLSGIPGSAAPEGTTSGSSSRSPKGLYFRPVQNLRPNQMIRTVDVNNCDTMEEMAGVIQDQRKNYLRDEDRNLPWWEFVRIANNNTINDKRDGASASVLCLRLDHAIGDGFSVGNICSKFLSSHPNGTLLEDFIPESMKVNKKQIFAGQNRCGIIWRGFLSMLNIGMLPISSFDSKTTFSKNVANASVRVCQKSTMVAFPEIPIAFVKAIKDKANVSFNDILMTALSQAIHDYCIRHSCPVIQKFREKTLCRGLVMVGFPSKDIRNAIATISLDFCIGVDQIADRLKKIHQTSSQMKRSPIAHCQMALVNKVLPILPLWLYQKIAYRIASRHSLTYTSIPGPEVQVYVAGKPVSGCRAAVVGHLHPIVTILSYNNHISVTLVADSVAIPKLHSLEMLFGKGLVDLANEYDVEIPLEMSQFCLLRTAPN